MKRSLYIFDEHDAGVPTTQQRQQRKRQQGALAEEVGRKIPRTDYLNLKTITPKSPFDGSCERLIVNANNLSFVPNNFSTGRSYPASLRNDRLQVFFNFLNYSAICCG